MWRLAQNSDNIKPAEVDDTSSSKYVYVRKDFTEVEIKNQEGETYTVWQYYENKILKQIEAAGVSVVKVNDIGPWQEALSDFIKETASGDMDLYKEILSYAY